jgi:hypothetical protein
MLFAPATELSQKRLKFGVIGPQVAPFAQQGLEVLDGARAAARNDGGLGGDWLGPLDYLHAFRNATRSANSRGVSC